MTDRRASGTHLRRSHYPIAKSASFARRALRPWLALAASALLLVGCASQMRPAAPLGQQSFDAYRGDTMAWIQAHRYFQSTDVVQELLRNAPREWVPKAAPSRGIVLVHGLGDSPWSFNDIGDVLAEQGFLVRTVLLPGHGTSPADLLQVRLDDWRRVISEQVKVLAAEVPQVYLGGFSTGANLALEYALDHADVEGLVLFSPAFRSNVPVDWIAPWLARLTSWVQDPDSANTQQTTVRYMNIPTNGFAQFYRSASAARHEIAERTFDKPALLVVAQNDSVVDVEFVRRTFTNRFTHPRSRMIWYGDEPADRMPRLLVRPDRLADERVSQFSHMGILFAPDNPLYGRGQRTCQNGQGRAQQQQCEEGAPIWYSDWGYKEAGKIHARMTFNPYFEWQSEVLKEVLHPTER